MVNMSLRSIECQFNNVDLDVPGLFTSRTERRPVKFKVSLEKLKS